MARILEAGARSARAALAIGIVVLACVAAPGAARAQDLPGPFFEAGALPRSGYDVRLHASYFAATRRDFAAPVFLFGQPVARIEAQELRIALDMRLALSSHLAVQAVVPISTRFASVRLRDVLISQRQLLEGAELELSNVGIADSVLTAAYRVFRSERWALYGEASGVISLGDNSGGLTVPRYLPIGTGQSALRLGAGASLDAGSVRGSAAFRFDYYPGNAAAYLVRRVGTQGYTSGSLDSRTGYHVSAQGTYAFSAALDARLSARWSAVELPRLVTREGSVRFLSGDLLQEVDLGVELRWQFDPQQSLGIELRTPLLASHDRDPFFPIAMPERGLGLTWQATGY